MSRFGTEIQKDGTVLVSLLADETGEPVALVASFADMPGAQRYLELESRAEALESAEDSAGELAELRGLLFLALKIVGPVDGYLGVSGTTEDRAKFARAVWAKREELRAEFPLYDSFSGILERLKERWDL